MPDLSHTTSPPPRTFRASWVWLVAAATARFYLAFMGTLAAIGLAPMLLGLSGAVVQSGSMEPHISRGDVVLSSPLAPEAPTPMGRVVTFEAPAGSATTGFVLHRVVAANKNGTLVTAGDANPSPDSAPLPRRNIISEGRLLVRGPGCPPSGWGPGPCCHSVCGCS